MRVFFFKNIRDKDKGLFYMQPDIVIQKIYTVLVRKIYNFPNFGIKTNIRII